MIGYLVLDNFTKDDNYQYIANSPNSRAPQKPIHNPPLIRPRVCFPGYCVCNIQTHCTEGVGRPWLGHAKSSVHPKPVWGLWAHNTGPPLWVHKYFFLSVISIYYIALNRYWGIRHKWKVRIYCTPLALKYPISWGCKSNALFTSPLGPFTWGLVWQMIVLRADVLSEVALTNSRGKCLINSQTKIDYCLSFLRQTNPCRVQAQVCGCLVA